MTTKYLDGVQLTEGRSDSTPRLIGSFNYNELTASAVKYKLFPAVLNRNAKARTIILSNTLNQPTTSTSFVPMDSSYPDSALSTTGGTSLIAVLSSNNSTVETSENKPLLAAHVDGTMIGIGMGATLPTTGKINVYIIEVF